MRRSLSFLDLNLMKSLSVNIIGAGSADFYPRVAPTWEWNTAAARDSRSCGWSSGEPAF